MDNNEDNLVWFLFIKFIIFNVIIVGVDIINGVCLCNGIVGNICNLVVIVGEGYFNCLWVNGDELIVNVVFGEFFVEYLVVVCEVGNNFGLDVIGGGII